MSAAARRPPLRSLGPWPLLPANQVRRIISEVDNWLDLLTITPSATVHAFSHYGIGVKVHAIERQPDGRVEFTLWFTVFFVPIVPLSS
jgi:hypothetical protein